ncbi:MAG: tripartite tricarboxylate transporter substrate-binding protein [Pseudolabrys sp.]
MGFRRGRKAASQSGSSSHSHLAACADVLARILGNQISETNGQTVIVDNRPGAGASIAYELAARAAPDGNTLVIASNSVVINPLLKKTNYNPLTSYEAICNLVSSPSIFVVNNASPYQTIGDLIDEATRQHYAKIYARPGAMHAAFNQFAAFSQDASDNKAFAAKAKLTMPILALGAEKSFGAQQAEIMREVGTNVESGIIANSGHWIMEEQPDATVTAVRDFLVKR